MMWAATLAGIAFGNAGVHVPHAMAYAVAGLVQDFALAGLSRRAPLVPHGMAVARQRASRVSRARRRRAPERHLEAAALLGADVRGARPTTPASSSPRTLIALMRAVGAPNGFGGVGYAAADIAALVEGALPQQRLLDERAGDDRGAGSPQLFRGALRYW